MIKPKRLLTYSLGLTLLLGSIALLGLLVPRRGAGNGGATCQYRVCVARFGYHSMLILPAVAPLLAGLGDLMPTALAEPSSPPALGPALGPAMEQPASSGPGNSGTGNSETEPLRYLGIGWGERRWYVNPPAEDAKLLQGLRALLLPNAAVIKVQRYSRFPTEYETICVGVTAEHFLQLVDFIRDTFKRDAQNRPIYAADDPKHKAQFYEAKGTYSLFNNSNHWTASGLQIVGADTPFWPAHAAAIMRVVQPTCAVPTALFVAPANGLAEQPNLARSQLPSANSDCSRQDF